MKYTLDRFEETFAILEAEDRSIAKIPRQNLPKNVREGSILTLTGSIWTVDLSETENAANRIRTKMDLLWK